MSDLGGKLAWFDRLVRGIIGVALILAAGLAGWSVWIVVVAGAIGGILVFEAVANYCPLATLLPWNR